MLDRSFSSLFMTLEREESGGYRTRVTSLGRSAFFCFLELTTIFISSRKISSLVPKNSPVSYLDLFVYILLDTD